jgi:dTDP-4-amino-4,6-dideoxygalactose transaminase
MAEHEKIPFNRPTFAGNEFMNIQKCLEAMHISGNGSFTKLAEELLSDLHDGSPTLLTTSCTHALEMSALLLDIRPGDEVIVPAFTFVSTVNAFLLAGARPIFVDVRRDTLNMDLEAATNAISSKTRAICIVHYGGVGATPDQFAELASARGLCLIEDNAHGFTARYKGQRLGTFGDLSTLSFHETKNVTCGEGGAVVFNDQSLLARAEVLREKGTNRSKFLRGVVDKYTWVDKGSSWVMSDILAAILVSQLEALEKIQAARKKIWNAYQAGLHSWSVQNSVELPVIPHECDHPAHLFHLRFQTLEQRSRFIDHMSSESISAVFHYQSLNSSPFGQQLGGRAGQCPNSEWLSDCLVRLPLFSSMTAAQTSRVIEVVNNFKI